MICSHFFRSQAKLVLVVPSIALRARARCSITIAQQGELLQPFCGAEISTSTPRGLHVDPDRAGGDAVEHEQAADLVHGVADGAQVVVGQDHARWRSPRAARTRPPGCSRADRRPPLRRSGAGAKGACAPLPLLARLAARSRRRRDAAHVEDLRPAVAEPAVAHDQHLLAGGELARDRLHAEGAAAGHEHRRARVVDAPSAMREMSLHHALEAAATCG